ncbi:MAG: acylphosphatase [Candidatus Methanoperedens sp.]|nr:acylphosphatase [Candidatus Methanoperedens sp.]
MPIQAYIADLLFISTNLIQMGTYVIPMQTRIKRYNLLLKGKVQHIGYRGFIEGTARKLDLKGYVFNDVDGSVKIACEGLQNSIDAFIASIKEFARSDIDTIEKKEINEDIYLPSVFSRVATDEYYEFSKKFDIGIDFLGGIKTDTGGMRGSLDELKNTSNDTRNSLEELKNISNDMRDMSLDIKNASNGMKGSLSNIDNKLGTIDNSLGTFVIEQREHNLRLEKILEKLAER